MVLLVVVQVVQLVVVLLVVQLVVQLVVLLVVVLQVVLLVVARHQPDVPATRRRPIAQMAIAVGLARDVRQVARVFVQMSTQQVPTTYAVHSSGSVVRNIVPPSSTDARIPR